MFLVTTASTATQHTARLAELCCSPIDAAPLDIDRATELATALKALADPVRLQLLSIIAAAPPTSSDGEGESVGEVCACDLPALVGRSQSTISHHLSQLVNAGFILREQRGKWAWFRLRPDCLDTVASFLRCSAEPTGA